MPAHGDPSSGWITYEVYQSDSARRHGIQSFSDALAISGSLPTQPITKIRIVQSLGWPAAKWSLKDDSGRPLIVKKDDPIWLLKCKPTCLRLYFYVCKKD